MIIINLKNYKIGKPIVDLVRTIEIYFGKAIIAVPPVELSHLMDNTNLTVYSQHVDYHEPGKSTGYTLPESLVSLGVKGTLISHSEHKIKMAEIRKTVKRCNENDIKSIVCVSSLKEVDQVKKLNPYAIAFEDKKLISTGKSITQYDKKELTKFVEKLKGTNILPICGAGITTGQDVTNALIMGCKGVLVSSAIANSTNPEKVLKEFASIF